ncbi:BspA family leucine-rich repeat surface protein, partial [Enterococcus faecium]|nr:BspA family leucine-rich repeat surface protein [Enterococcus faecium]
VSSWDTSNVTSMYFMFYGTTNLSMLDVSSWDTSKVTNMDYMFSTATNLSMLDVSSWDTSNVTSMRYMFDGTPNLSMLDVSSWDTSNVTNMSSMFNGATNLSMLDVSSWDTSNVTNMSSMFNGATNLSMLDVSSWDTSKVTNMSSMFNGATNLSMLDVSSWDTSKVTNMSSMFDGATNLSMLDVSSWDTSKVTNMRYMFYGTKNLSMLDVSSWDTSNVTDMRSMFSGTKLSRLTLGNKFRFQEGASLGSPTLPPSQEGELTGKWIREDGNSEAYSPTEFMENYGTGDLTEGSYIAEVKKALITTEANPQTFPLGTDSSSLDTNKFVKNVKLGDTSLTSDEYTTKLVGTLSTDTVGDQTVKVEVSLNDDPTVKTEVEVPVIVEWGNSLVFRDDFNNGFSFTAASISLLNGTDAPKLVATKGDGFRDLGEVFFYALPDITIYSKSLDTVVTRIRETTRLQHPNDVRNRWNGLFEELGNQLNYGDILGIKVNQSYGSNANQNGKNTWVSRENELVTETEGFDTAYYELTEDGLKLLELSAHPNKQNVDYGTDVEKIDYTNYVKDVKIGEVVVPKEQYTAKLVGEFDTSKPGEQTIKVEVALQEDPTHKTQVEVPIDIVGTLTIEVPDALEFQEVKLANKEQIGKRKSEKPTGFKVTDSRGTGKQGGWYVTAQAITAEEIGIDDYLIYKQINGVSENLTDTVKIHQQEEQGNTEGPMTVDLTSWWTDSSGILLKIPKENTLRPNMDYQATLVFNIIEAP